MFRSQNEIYLTPSRWDDTGYLIAVFKFVSQDDTFSTTEKSMVRSFFVLKDFRGNFEAGFAVDFEGYSLVGSISG